MPLKCSFMGCASFVLAQDSELAFYQDVNTGGWTLGLGPEFNVEDGTLPSNICLVETGNSKFPYDAVCSHCLGKIGKVNKVCGFFHNSVNFSGKKVSLVSSNQYGQISGNQKWSNVMVRCDTIHFHGVKDLGEIINAGSVVARRSGLYPRNYQWRSYFFSCFNNVLLCLPTGMGKTLIGTMLMKAYQQRNPNKGQTFIVPTVVLVEQQAQVIERYTGLKVVRRSGKQGDRITWTSNEICVCTPAILLNAIKLNEVDMSQQSLLVLDEVHEASSPLSPYGLLLP
ncbi:Endoribonuclease Dicer like 2a, partial [Pseudolycoriella hygida]